MKNKMEDIDKLIKETLTQEEAKFYDELEEQNFFEMIGGLFRGRNSWFLIFINAMQFVLAAVVIYCIFRFFQTDDTNELIKWGFGGTIFFIGIIQLKTIAFMQLNRNALTREIKRLELQVSSISGKMDS